MVDTAELARRCEVTELTAAFCACPHCRNIPDPPPPDRRTYIARFQGHCSACDEPIQPGDRVTADGGGSYTCWDCADG